MIFILQDISDLFGADLPGEGSNAGQFLWRDGPFLRALKSGHWVVFDEVKIVLRYTINTCVKFKCVEPIYCLLIYTTTFALFIYVSLWRLFSYYS